MRLQKSLRCRIKVQLTVAHRPFQRVGRTMSVWLAALAMMLPNLLPIEIAVMVGLTSQLRLSLRQHDGDFQLSWGHVLLVGVRYGW